MANTFLGLPLEIRQMIYQQLLVDKSSTVNPLSYRQQNPPFVYQIHQPSSLLLNDGRDKPPRSSLHPSVLSTCKQIHGETIPILYGINTFYHLSTNCYESMGLGIIDALPMHHLTHLQHIHICHNGFSGNSFTSNLRNLLVYKRDFKTLRINLYLLAEPAPEANLEAIIKHITYFEIAQSIEMREYGTLPTRSVFNIMAMEVARRKKWQCWLCTSPLDNSDPDRTKPGTRQKNMWLLKPYIERHDQAGDRGNSIRERN